MAEMATAEPTTVHRISSTEWDKGDQTPLRAFSPWDYAVFVLLFLVSSIVGLYFSIKDRRKKSSDDYLMGSRKMSGWPVALSLTVSFVSAITVMGTPAEIYLFGTMFVWYVVACTVAVVITAEIFAPLFYELRISSVYEYLDLRFGKSVRIAGTVVFTLQTCVYLGMVMYMPALALNKVTGLSLVLSMCGTAAVCIFYTTIGGLKAVVWTDVIQCAVIWGGFVAIIIQGSIHVGGIGNVFKIAGDGGRIDFWTFDVDPRIRHSILSIVVGGSFMWLAVFGVNQSMVQRYLSCKTLKHAKLSLYLNDVGLFIVTCLSSMTGLTMYAVYHECDPLASGAVEKSDQMTPYLVMDILQQYPGIPGLFVACVYSGTLSTVSTGINALACTTLEDFVKVAKPDISDRAAVILSKTFVVVYGLLGLGIAFLVSLFDQILTMALKTFGVFGGPLLGVFCLGILTKEGNPAGALCGLFGGLFVGFWLAIGSNYYPPRGEFTRILPTSVENCDLHRLNVTTTFAYNSTVSTIFPEERGYPPIADGFYSLSYCHYSTVIVVATWLIGYLASLATRRCQGKQNVHIRLLAFSKWRTKRRKDNYVLGENVNKGDSY